MAQALDHPQADQLEAGRLAHSKNAWADALEALRAADAASPLEPEDIVRLADAAWWTADFDLAVALRERAYTLLVRSGEKVPAADLALTLAQDYNWRMQQAPALAFLARAERLLADEPEGAVHGSMMLMRTLVDPELDVDRVLQLSRDGVAIARRHNDVNIETLGLIVEGKVLVNQGEVTRGLALIDEATNAAVTGELNAFTTGIVFCVTIGTCAELGDFQRAGDWTERAHQWCERNAGESGWPGMCRVHEAEVVGFRGDWALAESTARQAAAELANFAVDAAGAAFYEAGQVRLRVGDLEGAEEAFRKADEHARDPQPGLALLRLAQGKPETAQSTIRRALDNPMHPPLWRVRMLPAAVKIGLLSGDLDLARTAVEELENTARTYANPSPVMAAHAACCRGALLLSEGQYEPALGKVREALRMWQQVRAPYEAAEARTYLASIYEGLGDTDAALSELETALAAYEKLGARPDIDITSQRLRDLRETRGSAAPKQATVRSFLFTDIVQSTALIEAIGDDAWTDVVRWHDTALRTVFAAHQGDEVDHAGDGFFVAFPTADDALAAAVAVQRRLAEHRRDHGFAPKVRVGIHVAEAVSDGEGFRGKGVHAAARIAAVAEGDEIVVSQDTLDSADVPYPTSNPRELALQGLAEAVKVATIDWVLLPD